MSEEPVSVGFAGVRWRRRPTVVMFFSQGDGQAAEPEIVLFGGADPGCAGMMNVHRTVAAILRILELVRGFSVEQGGWQGERLLDFTDLDGGTELE